MKRYKEKELINMDPITIYKLLLDGAICKFPKGFWKGYNAKENSIKITKYLIEKRLKWSREQVCTNLCYNIFRDNLLTTMVYAVYNYNLFDVLDAAYPG